MQDKNVLENAKKVLYGFFNYTKIEKEKIPTGIQKEVDEFFRMHCGNVGFSQAIKDLQEKL